MSYVFVHTTIAEEMQKGWKNGDRMIALDKVCQAE